MSDTSKKTSTETELGEDFRFLHCECSLASQLLKKGVTEIQAIEYPSKGSLMNSLFSLSQGFERLMKVIFVMFYHVQHSQYPNNKELKQYGHNLQSLLDNIVEKADYHKILNDDLQSYKEKQKPYVDIISILSEFAKISRYYNLDALTSDIKYHSPIVRWHNEVETYILKTHSKITTEPTEEIKQLDNISNCYFIGYNNSIISSVNDMYVLAQRYKTISKYSKLYLCKLIRGLCRLLDDINSPYGWMLKEFFLIFYRDNQYLKQKKNFTR